MGLRRSTWNARLSLTTERMLDAIPGIMIFLALVIAIIGAIFLPHLIIPLTALLAFYSSTRFCAATYAYLQGLKRIQAAEITDWYSLHAAKPHALPWNTIQHVVLIPNYKEPLEILEKTLENIAKSPEANRITIVMAMEAAERGSMEKAHTLQALFEDRFGNFFYTMHPAGLPGEIQSKSANLAWAGRWVKRKLVDHQGINIDHIVVTVMDADTLWHKDYFTALTYYFAVDGNRHKRFWQAPIRYHGNIYQIDPMFRLSAVYANAMELAYLSASWWSSLPISSYSLSLNLLDASDYWDTDVIADEWHMYIKAFFQRRTDLELVPIYLPFLATIVTGATFWQGFRNRYLQTVRHAWGSKEIGYTLSLFQPEVDFGRSCKLLFSVSHDLFLSGAGWVFLTFGSQLPALFHAEIRNYLISGGWLAFPYVIFQVAFLMLLMVTTLVLFADIRTRPPRSEAPHLQEIIRTFFGFVLLPLFTMSFVVLPLLHAQLMLLFGKPLSFEVTAKT